MAARGEGTINTEEKDYQILFTNRALATAEQQMGKSVLAVSSGLGNGSTGLFEMACLLQAGLEAARRDYRLGGKAFQLNDAYELMDAVGFAAVAQVVVEAMAAVLSYSNDNDDAPKKK